MKGMNISRNAFIGEINIQDIAAEREQPHNWAKNFMNLTKNYSFLTTVWPEPILINFVENTTYCISKVVHTLRPINDATEGSTQEAPMCAS